MGKLVQEGVWMDLRGGRIGLAEDLENFLRAGNGTEVIVESHKLSSRTLSSCSHPSKMEDM